MRRRTGMGRGGDEASKRVGGFYRSAKCARGYAPRNASEREAEVEIEAKARAARAAGEPLTRRARQGLAYQLPAIVSTGLNAPCTTL
ncbi:hypothetical protein LMG29660_01710 [Burkholderia puraquae]|uniref:Uncharacterized protein n=1 Tax=Burkholderia puraquae TaxID=1904757 RepID=A0A6J5DEF7_9BURK|nr:hypothetical protein LMG29660_01710 [Burkholderia puraquae]